MFWFKAELQVFWFQGLLEKAPVQDWVSHYLRSYVVKAAK